jgi:hypothetical protein
MSDIATNASAYRSERVTYLANWVNVRDAAGALQINPPCAFVAGALAHMPRHLGSHWNDEAWEALIAAGAVPEAWRDGALRFRFPGRVFVGGWRPFPPSTAMPALLASNLPCTTIATIYSNIASCI